RPTFPVGVPGLIEMDVDIDNSRERDQAGSVDLFAAARKFRLDSLDEAVLDRQVSPAYVLRSHDTSATDHKFRHVGTRSPPESTILQPALLRHPPRKRFPRHRG